MKHITLKLVTAAMLITATAMFVGGCSNKAQEIDLTLIGGDGQDIENNYTVDIRYDTDEPTAEPTEISEPDIPKEETTSPATTKATQPAVTVTTDKPQVTTPAQTVRTDLPKVTAEPQYTTAVTTTTKPAKQTEPAEIQTDDNGFPANPNNGDKFTDSTGQTYQYDGSLFFRWVPYNNDGKTIVQEFPTFEVEGGDEIILH